MPSPPILASRVGTSGPQRPLPPGPSDVLNPKHAQTSRVLRGALSAATSGALSEVARGASSAAPRGALNAVRRGTRVVPPSPPLPATPKAHKKVSAAHGMMTATDRDGGEVAEEAAADGEATGTSRHVPARSPPQRAPNPIADRDRMTNQNPPDAATTSRKLAAEATMKRAIAMTYRMRRSTGSDSRLRRAMMLAKDVYGSGGGVAVAVGVEEAEAERTLSVQHQNRAVSGRPRIWMTNRFLLVTAAVRAHRHRGLPHHPTVLSGLRNPKASEEMNVLGGAAAPAAREVGRHPSRRPRGRSPQAEAAGNAAENQVNPVRDVSRALGPTSRPYRAATTKTTKVSSSLASRKPLGRG